MAKILNIDANIKAACKEAWVARKDIFGISWFILLLILIYRWSLSLFLQYLRKQYPNHFKIDYYTFHMPFDYPERIFDAGEQILYSIIIVAFTRLLLAREIPPFKTINIKKGDLWEDKVVAKIPIYLSFGQRELRFALMSIIFSVIFLTLRDFALFIDVYIPAQKLIGLAGTEFAQIPTNVPHIPLGYQVLHRLIRTWGTYFFEAVYSAPFIMVWPYLAICEGFNFSLVLKLIRAVRGNILRIAIIKFMIMLPWDLMESIQSLFGSMFERLGWWHFWQFEYDVYINVHSIMFFICEFVAIIFSVNVYKNFASQLENAPASK